jgi:4'-phosphopantetheinyl transferase
MLSADELRRAGRFLLPLHRDRFVTGLSILRRVLGAHLGTPPESVELARGKGGKPALAGAQRLRFNLSHSADRGLLALALDREVGVDLERFRPEVAVEDIARRYFSPSEQEELLSLPREARTAAFFACWTRKEAFLKARGDGLFSLPLGSFDVTVRPDRPPELRRTGFDPGEARRYSLLGLPEIPGFAACLAVEGAPPAVRCFSTI